MRLFGSLTAIMLILYGGFKMLHALATAADGAFQQEVAASWMLTGIVAFSLGILILCACRIIHIMDDHRKLFARYIGADERPDRGNPGVADKYGA